MSEDSSADTSSSCCASCGIAEVDDVKLMECDACDRVEYCSIKCQIDHRKQHQRDCNKRVAELRDELLFKQPECTHLGDCPICCLPLPHRKGKYFLMVCCSKIICTGCTVANGTYELKASLDPSCPFCREPVFVSKTKEEKTKEEEEVDKRMLKRIEANDPVAMTFFGIVQYKQGEYIRSLEYWTKAADLGDAEAHCKLADLYTLGHGVEKDRGKQIHHAEEAAIGGHPEARYGLGCEEWNNGNADRAVKHWIIAAKQGDDNSIKRLMGAFKEGFFSKEDLTATLRAHQAAVDATKSPEREAVEKLLCKRSIWAGKG